MPRRRHHLGISERKELARELFIKGRTNAEVSREVGVHPDTVTRYRREYEESLSEAAEGNPSLLRDVLKNTVRALEHLDRVRSEAWVQYEEAENRAVKATFLNTVLKAEGERAKLLGLMGVKPDTLAYVEKVRRQSEELMRFMRENLCPTDRDRLIGFITDQFAEDLSGIATISDLTQS